MTGLTRLDRGRADDDEAVNIGAQNCVTAAARNVMPTISSFYGILIRMYFFDAEQHHLPHIHAQYQGQQAQFAIGTGEVLAGGLPRRKLGSCKPGSKYIETSCPQPGKWP